MAGMIATPLTGPRSERRRLLANGVVAGAAVSTFLGATGRWGLRRAAAAAGIVTAGTTVIEQLGTRSGWPFGRYCYTGRLHPTVGRHAVGVPVVVPLAWWAMALPAREVAHAALGRRRGTFGRVGLGAAALAAWDLFLDPQMTAEGYWRWDRRGRYRGIPLSNYAGWLAVGGAVMGILERLLPPGAPDAALVAQYVVAGVMEAVGFLCFFGDPLVAVVGAAGMLPISAFAARALVIRG
jgi:uncharacterized membrane protein